MAALPESYRAVVLDQQTQLRQLIQAEGVGPLRRLYEEMLSTVTSRIRGVGAGTFDEAQLRGMAAQLKLGMAGIVREMGGQLGDASYEVGIQSARQALQHVADLERHFTGALVPLPLVEIARLRGLVKDQAPSMLRYQARSLARYGSLTVSRFELGLQRSLASGFTGYQAIEEIHRVGETSWYGAERIVRTELSYSSNASIRGATEMQSEELDGDLWMRWSEHVSDDGAPFDDRVGVDSEALHGQVAPPGGLFTQPPRSPQGEEVGESLVGEQWAHPPNRPNDRAVLTPWRSHWGVPGWVWRDGRRAPATPKLVAEIMGKRRPREDAPEDAPPAPAPQQQPGRMAEAAAAEDEMPTRAAPAREETPREEAPQAAATPVESDAPIPLTVREQRRAGVAARREAREEARALREAMAPPKNPKRVAAARIAAEASAERLREIHSAVKGNLPDELHVVWEKEGHKFLQQEAGRIRGVKDRINAASKISEAFSETYGSGELGGKFGNEGDRFYKRTEIEAEHFEAKADEQERKYYEEMRRTEIEAGRIDEHGEPIKHAHDAHEVDEWGEPVRAHHAPKPDDDDPPF